MKVHNPESHGRRGHEIAARGAYHSEAAGLRLILFLPFNRGIRGDIYAKPKGRGRLAGYAWWFEEPGTGGDPFVIDST